MQQFPFVPHREFLRLDTLKHIGVVKPIENNVPMRGTALVCTNPVRLGDFVEHMTKTIEKRWGEVGSSLNIEMIRGGGFCLAPSSGITLRDAERNQLVRRITESWRSNMTDCLLPVFDFPRENLGSLDVIALAREGYEVARDIFPNALPITPLILTEYDPARIRTREISIIQWERMKKTYRHSHVR